ncbi:MAG TPA: MaoC family dehydratase [Polyangia bacterium]|nr:MaoC family dehydratase [Polyangia bacterium]
MPTENSAGACRTSLADVPLHVGRKLGPTEWKRMTQDEVDRFAALTGDHNFIHVDPARARATVFGGTIAHGYLTLSLLGPISQELLTVEDAALSINYGLNKVRFPAPLPVGAEYRGHGQLLEVSALDKGVQVTATFTVEVKDAPKPAVVADCVFRYYR